MSADVPRPVLVARCENYREDVDQACHGEIRFRWGMSQSDPCDVCGGRCGIAVAAWERVELAEAVPETMQCPACGAQIPWHADGTVPRHIDRGRLGYCQAWLKARALGHGVVATVPSPPTYVPGDLLLRVLPEGEPVPSGWTLHTWTLYGRGLIYRTATEAGTAPHGTRVVTPAEGMAITEAAARAAQAGTGVPWDGRGADPAAVVHAVVQHDRADDDGRPWSYQ